MPPANQGPIVLHLDKSKYKVKWYANARALNSGLKQKYDFPPQSADGCELRVFKGTSIRYCENAGCKGICTLNEVPGTDYRFCTCDPRPKKKAPKKKG